MLVDGDDGVTLNHHLVGVIVSVSNILVHEGDNVLAKHVQTRGLVCSVNGLKVFANLDK